MMEKLATKELMEAVLGWFDAQSQSKRQRGRPAHGFTQAAKHMGCVMEIMRRDGVCKTKAVATYAEMEKLTQDHVWAAIRLYQKTVGE
ncbi:hypothetical protein [Rhizobium sp. RAF56]|uniref:hypothetical protein n=1 Tax=Rhizobium sp. RAF56 TaxID=3233062 RepID=UPI003F9DC309